VAVLKLLLSLTLHSLSFCVAFIFVEPHRVLRLVVSYPVFTEWGVCRVSFVE